MSRLIDADELKKMFPDKGEGAWTYNTTAKAYIDAQPTVDEWHYPSKGEYPTEGEEVFCCLKRPDGFVKNWYETGYYNRQKWSCNVDEDFLSELLISGYKLEVIAWQYIVPPKEEA